MTKLVCMDEVFAMAVQIEINGAKFYRKAAELQSDDADRDMLLKLAAMEDGHVKLFENMRKGASVDVQEDSGDLQSEGAMYLEAIATGYELEGSPAAAAELTGSESLEDILRLATRLEQKAVLFYMGIQKVVSDPVVLGVLDTIIDEERSHIVTVMHELNKHI